MGVLLFGPCDELEGLECQQFGHDVEKDHGGEIKSGPTTKNTGSLKRRRRRLMTQLRNYFKFHTKTKVEGDDDSNATASTAVDSIWSDPLSLVSKTSTLEEVHEDLPPIKKRLDDMDVEVNIGEHYEFIRDFVSKEVVGMYDDEPTEDENVAHVKTGIWQVIEIDDDGTPLTPFYVVTGVLMTDTVDNKKLRRAIFAGKKQKRRPKISLAPTDIAERLAGCRSGTIAPICHLDTMKLYLEESIVNSAADNTRVAVGSGMFGTCLSIELGKFLEIAERQGLELHSIVRAKR